MSQAVLAGLVGRSESWLSQVERGKRGIDRHSVLVRLAEVLRVDVEDEGERQRHGGRRGHCDHGNEDQCLRRGCAVPTRLAVAGWRKA